MQEKMATYQTRFSLEEEIVLDTYAKLYSKLERKLFANLMAKKDLLTLKKSYIQTNQITARQFNSLSYEVRGKIQSAKERQKEILQELPLQIRKCKRYLKKAVGQKRFAKQKRLHNLEKKYKKIQTLQKQGKVSLCFGGKKLFREQFQKEHTEWKQKWTKTRDNHFFCIGSKDETSGNQSCTLIQKEDTFSLRLRLPHALEKSYGKYLVINHLTFAYGQKEIKRAYLENTTKDSSYRRALSYRFVKDEKGWRVFLSLPLRKKAYISNKLSGAIGIDINADHLAVCETDRFGNPISSKKIPLCLYGKSKTQSLALIGDRVKEIMIEAKKARKPLAIEKLNFQQKKKQLKKESPRYARMLSSFSYSKIKDYLKSASFKEAIEVLEVDPAYTSMLGHIKYARRYGLSTHTSAALCIGRKGLNYSEKIPYGKTVELCTKNNTSLFFAVPVRNPQKNKDMLGVIYSKYKAAHVVHFKAEKIRSLLRDEKSLGVAGEIPARESWTKLLGSRVYAMTKFV